MKTTRPTALLAASLVILLSASPVSAVDYNWTASAGDHSWQWSNPENWSPAGVPGAPDANVSFNIGSGSSTIALGWDYVVNNFAVTASGGTTTAFTSIGTAGAYSLLIGGVLSKNNGSSSVAFYDENSGRLLNLTVNTLNFTNTGGGTFSFGRTDGGRWLNSLSIGQLNMGANHAAASTLRFNVASDYSLGLVTFGGSNTKDVYLINNGATAAGYSRTATVAGIRSIGSAATIHGSARASSGGNDATLRIDTAADTDFSASTVLADGIGGALSLLKTGEGRQTLSGALAHTGGTHVGEGTLVITGSLAATGDVSVSTGAAFVVGNSLAVRDVTLASGAILGFDLNASASLSLSRDLLKDGAGTGAFVIDFLNTGVAGQAYDGLLSVAGSATAFEDASISFVNFGASGLSGTLTFAELANGFTVVPEPSSLTFLGGGAVLLTAMGARRR